MIKNFDQLREEAIKCDQKKIAVAVAADKDVLEAVKESIELGISDFVLVGDKKSIESISNEIKLDLDKIDIIHETNDAKACELAVRQVSSGEADLLMKGLVSTSVILRAVLNKEYGLRTGKLLSHVAVLEAKEYDRLILMTDGGMNINPDIYQKIQLVENATQVANKLLKIDLPKVAPLCAVEKVNPEMQATVDAATLTMMNKRGQIKNCIIDGPLNLNGAVSKEAADHIGLDSPVAGDADIYLVPYIEVGNVMYKSMVYFAKARCAGIIVGAKVPIVLTSRADSHDAKVNSIASAVLLA
ncbi:MAG: phosphate butyryltransferase [Clostridia bacterium]